MLNVEGKNTRNKNLSCQSSHVSLVSMTIELLLPLIQMTVLKLRALGRPAALVRTGGLPSILQQTAPLVIAQVVNQGQEVPMLAVGAMKMGMRAQVPTPAADARQTGCRQRHQDTNRAD